MSETNDSKTVFIIMYCVPSSITIGEVFAQINDAVRYLEDNGFERFPGDVSQFPVSYRLKSGGLGWAAIHERDVIITGQKDECSVCGGTGELTSDQTCWTCRGRGEVKDGEEY